MFGGIQRTLQVSSSVLVSPTGCLFVGGGPAGSVSETSGEFLRRRGAGPELTVRETAPEAARPGRLSGAAMDVGGSCADLTRRCPELRCSW